MPENKSMNLNPFDFPIIASTSFHCSFRNEDIRSAINVPQVFAGGFLMGEHLEQLKRAYWDFVQLSTGKLSI